MTAVPRLDLAPGYSVSRLIKGGWQLAGGHGPVDRGAALDDMQAFAEAGITTFDCADIYTGVEALIGDYLRRPGQTAAMQVHTKYVPDRSTLGTLTASDVRAAVDRSRARLGVDALDLVQVHWWDYGRPGFVDTIRWLDECRQAGAIRHLGLTNCNTATVQAIVDAGVRVVSHQVQYSLLDQRPAGPMSALCRRQGIGLLCYGALAGGFFSERWLGVPAPSSLANRSLVKYRLIIDECGGWEHFQTLLAAAARVGARHGVGIGAVAIAWVLAQPQVAAVVVGATSTVHLASTVAAASLGLDAEDLGTLQQAIDAGRPVGGDIYDLERDLTGPHAAIMRYELNASTPPATVPTTPPA